MPALTSIAVVDDDESIRESLPHLLRELAFESQAFATAQEFLASSFIDRARCLVLDVTMPVMDGPALARELRRQRRMIPIVFMTGNASDNIRERLIAQGAVEVLTKPFNEAALVRALNMALATE
jgi:FixJ family two-component response regulator